MRTTNIRPEETLAEATARHRLIHTTGADEHMVKETLCWTANSPARCQYQTHHDCLAIYCGLMGLEDTQLYLNVGCEYKAYLPNGTVRKCQVEYDGARLDIDHTENDVRIRLRAFYVDELTVDAPAEALPDKNVDIILTHEEAQRIADQLFPWL